MLNVYHKILIGLFILLFISGLTFYIYVSLTDSVPLESNNIIIEYDERVELELILPELMYVGSTRQIRCFSSTIAFFDNIILSVNDINHTAVTLSDGLLYQYPYDFIPDSEGTFRVICNAYLDNSIIASKQGEVEVIAD